MIRYFVIMAVFGGAAGIAGLAWSSIRKYDTVKKWMVAMFAAYLGALFSFTILAGNVYPERIISLIPFKYLITNIMRENWYFVLQIIVNMIMFIPVGVFSFLWKKGAKFSMLLGIGLSLIIESLQLLTKRGTFDVDDLIMNTLGALAGYLLSKLILRPVSAKRLTAMILVFAFMVGLSTFSLFVSERRYRDEINRKSIIVLTSEVIKSYEEYDPSYTYSNENEGTYLPILKDVGGSLFLEVKDGRIKISGDGDQYSLYKQIYGGNEGWVTLEHIDRTEAEYKNVFQAGKHMILFFNEDRAMIFKSLSEVVIIQFERIKE